MRHSKFACLFSLLFLSNVISSPLDRVKDAHGVRFLIAGGLLVVSAAIDIAKKSDQVACEQQNSALDTRSFAEKWADRSAAIFTSKNWAALARDAVRVVWAAKNEKKAFLKRVAFFGKNHTLVSLMLMVNAANASASAYQLCSARQEPASERGEGSAGSCSAPVHTPVSDPQSPPAGGSFSGLTQKVSKLNRKIRRKVLVSSLFKKRLRNKRMLKKAEAIEKRSVEPLLATDSVLPVSLVVPCDSKTAVVDESVVTPVKAEQRVPETPSTIELTPRILTRNGAQEVGPGHYSIGVTPLEKMLAKRSRLRTTVRHLTVKGYIRGIMRFKGVYSGVVIKAEGLAREFDSPATRGGTAAQKLQQEENTRKRYEAHLKKLEEKKKSSRPESVSPTSSTDANPVEVMLPPAVPMPCTPPAIPSVLKSAENAHGGKFLSRLKPRSGMRNALKENVVA